jgi:hypothetical protein
MGDATLDAVLGNVAASVQVWNSAGDPPFVRTYKFIDAMPTNRSWPHYADITRLSESQKTLVRSALADYAAVANVSFVEMDDQDPGDASIAIGLANTGHGVSGVGYYRISATTRSHGVVKRKTMDSLVLFNTNANLASTSGRSTILHELGHAFTLKHTGNYDVTGATQAGPFLPAETDNNQYTVMSYNVHPGLVAHSMSLMLYDIEALQARFGANTDTNAGDTVYTGLGDRNALTVWDAGGNDTFDFSGRTDDLSIDLRPGGFSSIGATDNLAVAYGVSIENATGGAGNDVFTTGNSGGTITGGAGADTVFANGPVHVIGGAGADILVLAPQANADVVEYSSPNDGGAPGNASGFDLVANFQSGVDGLVVSGALRALIDNGDGVLATAVRSPGTIDLRTDELIAMTIDTGALAAMDTLVIEARLGGLAGTSDRTALVLANDGTDTGLFTIADTDANGRIAASEMRLLASFTGSVLTLGDVMLS